ncbi:unnamed protein product [Urochloa humidicola]
MSYGRRNKPPTALFVHPPPVCSDSSTRISNSAGLSSCEAKIYDLILRVCSSCDRGVEEEDPSCESKRLKSTPLAATDLLRCSSQIRPIWGAKRARDAPPLVGAADILLRSSQIPPIWGRNDRAGGLIIGETGRISGMGRLD